MQSPRFYVRDKYGPPCSKADPYPLIRLYFKGEDILVPMLFVRTRAKAGLDLLQIDCNLCFFLLQCLPAFEVKREPSPSVIIEMRLDPEIHFGFGICGENACDFSFRS